MERLVLVRSSRAHTCRRARRSTARAGVPANFQREAISAASKGETSGAGKLNERRRSAKCLSSRRRSSPTRPTSGGGSRWGEYVDIQANLWESDPQKMTRVRGVSHLPLAAPGPRESFAFGAWVFVISICSVSDAPPCQVWRVSSCPSPGCLTAVGVSAFKWLWRGLSSNQSLGIAPRCRKGFSPVASSTRCEKSLGGVSIVEGSAPSPPRRGRCR